MTTATGPTKTRKPATIPATPSEDAPLFRSNDPISPFKTITKKQTATAEQPGVPAKSEQPAKIERPAKPEVDRLAKVIEQQSSPTMWQFARIAKFVIQRTEAGQSFEDAFNAVCEQTYNIIQGICQQMPPSSKDSDVDTATKAFFFIYAPKSTSRERGPTTAE